MRVGALHDWPLFIEAARHAAADRRREVGVVEDDVGRLAAELLRDALHRVGRGLARPAMPARVEPVNDTMSTSGCAAIACADGRAVAVHEVEHAGRHAGLVQDLGERGSR